MNCIVGSETASKFINDFYICHQHSRFNEKAWFYVRTAVFKCSSVFHVKSRCVSQYVHLLWSLRSCRSSLFCSFEVKWCDYLCVRVKYRVISSEQRAKVLVSHPHETAVMLLSVNERWARTCLYEPSLWRIRVSVRFSCVPVVMRRRLM